ncbi:GntR family transcriptional regulator [Alicyclobacillus dauci]|uniref:GntR family transcriptional regulator n=1 Tax=Alicyclobacillus dauci TaxID=1475485 RepID=A0ABY6Z735_9BACL|nr:GntR family transcriptional regulator [Alicyclobacillus dauci]WAH38069.1 GntR family transcriptional regulator [Alicyclobacillus dauci]
MAEDEVVLNEEACYERLRDDIRNGVLMPNERLVEMDLAKSLNAGRAAVRTALARLEQEGLVERERYRGARVRLVSEAEAAEILEVRAAVECVTVRHAAINATPEDDRVLEQIVDELDEHYRANDLLKYSDCNARLHRTLITMARHTTAAKVLDTLNSQSVRFQYRTILAKGRPERSLAEHKAIVRGVINRDPDEAEFAMRQHLAGVLGALQDLDSRM